MQGKKNNQRTPTKDLNPVCRMHYELQYTTCEHFHCCFYETAEKNLQQIPDPEKDILWNLLNTPQIAMDSVHIRFLQLPSERCLVKLTSSLQAAYLRSKIREQDIRQKN